MDRVIAIGDIHGEPDQLNNLLGILRPGDKDLLVFLGDYIDFGTNPKAVVARLIEFRDTYQCVFLKGNHEFWFLDYMDGCRYKPPDVWMSNGASSTLRSYGIPLDVRAGDPLIRERVGDEHEAFLRDARLYYLHEIGGTTYLFVHAGRNPGKPICKNERKEILEVRNDFFDWAQPWPECDVVVYGHAVQEKPNIVDRRIGIDTGCGRDATRPRPLTALTLPGRETFQA